MIQAIVYTSNAGHTREYAEILGQEIRLPVYELAAAKHILTKGTEIVYLGWLMAGVIKGYKKANRYFTIKALCGVGMAANGSQITDISKANKLSDGLPLFSLQGGFELDKLHGIYKLMMSTMQKTAGKGLADKQERTSEEDEMLALLQIGDNLVKKENLNDILAWYSMQSCE